MADRIRFQLGIGLVVYTLLSICGCHSRIDPASERALMNSGISAIPAAAEMDRLYEFVDHFVGSGESADGTRTWNSEAFVYDRYVLTMQVEVKVSLTGTSVAKVVGSPKFRLIEVVKVYDANGSVGAEFGESIWFGPEEWAKVAAANGDFSGAGIVVETSKPIPDFALYRDATRKPRIKLKE